MLHYLLIFRSLTQAQQAIQILRSIHIITQVNRSPKSLSGEGCSHSIRLAERQFGAAIHKLRQSRILPRKAFFSERDGIYREVSL
jgi:Protein of unknown function (DUF3343).